MESRLRMHKDGTRAGAEGSTPVSHPPRRRTVSGWKNRGETHVYKGSHRVVPNHSTALAAKAVPPATCCAYVRSVSYGGSRLGKVDKIILRSDSPGSTRASSGARGTPIGNPRISRPPFSPAT